MATGWRIIPSEHAAKAFDGEGARLNGGRWNSPGVRMIYASEHKSLAALEILVHVNPRRPRPYTAFSLQWDDSLSERRTVAQLPADWRQSPPGASSAGIGDAWARQSRSAVLAVPSILIPEEWNFLLNPTHPDFRKITIGPPEAFAFDPRLLV
jgi:RES domain-containing protein